MRALFVGRGGRCLWRSTSTRLEFGLGRAPAWGQVAIPRKASPAPPASPSRSTSPPSWAWSRVRRGGVPEGAVKGCTKMQAAQEAPAAAAARQWRQLKRCRARAVRCRAQQGGTGAGLRCGGRVPTRCQGDSSLLFYTPFSPLFPPSTRPAACKARHLGPTTFFPIREP